MIGPKTIQRMKDTACEKIDAWQEKMASAYMKSDDGKLKVSLGYTIYLSKETQGGLDVEATIAFTAEKISDKTISTVVENQADLPLGDKIYKMDKKGE